MARTFRYRLTALAGSLAATVLLANCGAPQAPPTQEPAPGAQAPPSAKPPVRNRVDGAGPLLKNGRSDLGSGITATAIARLNLAWDMRTTQPVSHTPIVDEGRVYVADWGGRVWAMTLETGEVLWRKSLQEPDTSASWHGFVGSGDLGGGRLYEASAEGQAFAIDPASGKVLWKTRLSEEPGAGNIADIRYFDGLVYVGLASVKAPGDGATDPGATFRGSVIALDAATGEKVWERLLANENQRGIAMWSSFAVDAELGALYFTTGTPYAGPAEGLSNSLVALEPRTGRLLWSRRLSSSHGSSEFAAGPQLFEGTVNGQPVRLVGAGQKSGTFWVLDRRSGEVVWMRRLGASGEAGGLVGEASVGQGRLLLWSNDGFDFGDDPAATPMMLSCLDAGTGQVIWARKQVQPAWIPASGFLSAGIYFVGSLDGQVRGYGIDDGKLLWTSARHGSIGSGLWVSGETLLFGLGVPTAFGGLDGPSGLAAYRIGAAGLPSPSPTPSPGASPSATPSPTPSATASPSPSPTPTASPSPSPSPTASPGS